MCIFVMKQNKRCIQEVREIRFWFKPSVGEDRKNELTEDFFKDLLSPTDFPTGENRGGEGSSTSTLGEQGGAMDLQKRGGSHQKKNCRSNVQFFFNTKPTYNH